MALDTIETARQEIAKIYIAAFNRVPDSAGLNNWMNQYNAGLMTYDEIAADFANQAEYIAEYPAYMTDSEYITAIYNNVFGRDPDAGGLQNWINQIANPEVSGITRGSVMHTMLVAADATGNTDGERLDNQASFAVQSILDEVPTDIATAQLVNITSVDATVTTATAAVAAYAGTITGTTLALTTGVDTITGTVNNDTITAQNSELAAGGDSNTLSALDAINGGAGVDTFNIVDVSVNGLDTSDAGGLAVSNVETANFRAAASVTANTTTWTGLTAANVTQATSAAVTAAATTAVSVSGATTTVAIDGGSTQTVTTAGTTVTLGATTGATGAVSVTHTAQAANAIAVDGGTAVTVVATGVTAGTVAIGQSPVTASPIPTGVVSVTSTGAHAVGDGDHTLGAITIDGGSTVTVTVAAANAAALTAAATDTTNNTVTQGAVNVGGGAATTAVTVNQTAAATAVNYNAATPTTGVLGVVAGAVTIADLNAASGTVAGTLATVTLNNYGAATIDSSALTTVNLQGTGGTLGISRGALTATPTANTLAITTTSATIAAITDSEAGADEGFTTINLTNSGTSTVANLTAADATALTVAGTGALTFTAAALLANVTSVNVTNTTSTTFGTTTLNVASTFTSGAGAESVIIGATTKAISTGAGDDTVTLTAAALGTAGTVDAGADTDTLVISSDNAATATATDTFEGTISGFERLTTNAVQTGDKTINLANLDNINYVSLAGAVVGQTLTLSNVTTGVTVNANSGAAGIIDVTLATNGVADTINFGVSNTTAKTVFKLDASEYETIAITTDDSATTATSIAHIITTLDATAATALTITGDAGLTVGTLTGTALTSINASNVTAGAVTFTTGALAAASTINGGAGNDVISAASALAAVTLNGNAGNDTLTGGTVADIINGGAGNDLIYGNQGADNLTGGTGADIFAVTTATHSNGVNVDTVTDFIVGTDKIATVIGVNAGETITYLGEANAYGSVLTSFTGVDNQAVLDTSTNTIYIDVDGSQTLDAVDIAINVGVSDLSQSDFATLGTTGADAILLSAGIDTVYSLGGADTITAAANTTAIAALSTDTLSIATTGMDIINAVATATINLTAPLGTDGSYDVVTNAAAGAVITKVVGATTVNQFVGLYDYATGTFTSSATTAAASTSTTDVAASMFLYATADALVADEGIILIGAVGNATALNGVLTLV